MLIPVENDVVVVYTSTRIPALIEAMFKKTIGARQALAY